MVTAPFDTIAGQYDLCWTNTTTGKLQREAVWRRLEPFFFAGDRIIDLGCGTGADALHFKRLGLNVYGIDASAEMVRIARAKGIEAEHLAIEDLDNLTGMYDGAISNFGVLNCIERLDLVGAALARRMRSGGMLAICVMGSFCLWETCHFLRQLKWRAAFRRLSRSGVSSSIGVNVTYPSVFDIKAALKDHFKLLSWYGIGLLVPPSYIHGLSAPVLARLGAIDRHVAHLPVLRALSDHRLFLFERL